MFGVMSKKQHNVNNSRAESYASPVHKTCLKLRTEARILVIAKYIKIGHMFIWTFLYQNDTSNQNLQYRPNFVNYINSTIWEFRLLLFCFSVIYFFLEFPDWDNVIFILHGTSSAIGDFLLLAAEKGRLWLIKHI